MTLREDIEKRISDLKIEEAGLFGQIQQLNAKIQGLNDERNLIVADHVGKKARREENEQWLASLSLEEADTKTPKKEKDKE